MLWNLIFDELIELLNRLGIDAIAFADDLVVLITRNCREMLQKVANLIITEIIRMVSKTETTVIEHKNKSDSP